jgi:hypothetical protein
MAGGFTPGKWLQNPGDMQGKQGLIQYLDAKVVIMLSFKLESNPDSALIQNSSGLDDRTT